MKNASRTKIVPRLAAVLLATAALALAGPASAIGLGNIVAKSQVGSPFQAEIELHLTDSHEADTVMVRSARSDVYEQEHVRYSSLASSLVVRLVQRDGRYFAQLYSPQAVADPVVTIILEGSTYSGTVRRTYEVPMAVQMERGPKPPTTEQLAIEAEKRAQAQAQALAEAQAQAQAQAQARAAARQAKRAFAMFVTEKGERPVDIARVTASGDNEPLAKALSKIVPDGWRGFANDPAVKTAQPVTWSATDKPWPEVLKDVISTRGVKARIDWIKKEVEFSANRQVAPAVADEDDEAPLGDVGRQIAAVEGVRQAAPVTQSVVSEEVSPETKRNLKSIQIKGGVAIGEHNVSSFGVNVGLLSAAAQIVPEGWSVISHDSSVNNARLVGWNGRGRSWLTVFDEVLVKNSLTAKLDSERREIEIFSV